MFDREALKKLDRNYFVVLAADEYDLTIRSRNTGHYWYLHCTEYPQEGACAIFHKHRYSHPYHLHGQANSLQQAIRMIRKHDAYQLNGRRPVRRQEKTEYQKTVRIRSE